MKKLITLLTILLVSASPAWAGPSGPKELKDLYFGEALYYAFQGDWFDAIARLDSELQQHYAIDEPELDSLQQHLKQAEFDVGDFELFYRMQQRAGRAITAVIEGNADESVRNEAIFRLARMEFHQDQPESALQSIDRIRGVVPAKIRPDIAFLHAQALMAVGRNAEAAAILKNLQGEKSLEGFSSYNLGIALMKSGKGRDGRAYLDRAGRIESSDPAVLAIKDKANLVLGNELLAEKDFAGARAVLRRVRLNGPFSDRALLGAGWADASRDRFARALVPWNILAGREVTDPSVQDAMLAAPYAYAKLGVYSKAALGYGKALDAFGREIDRLTASITSIREGRFLKALVRDELKQDPNWVVRLRELPDAPETFYLLDLMASDDFQQSLKNYLDLEELRNKLDGWSGDLDAFADAIAQRRAYYEPLLPGIDRQFRRLDSLMRLRLEQRDHIEQRLRAMLTAPRPDFLSTGPEHLAGEQLAHLEDRAKAAGAGPQIRDRIRLLRGVLDWNILTEYDQRFTDAYRNLHSLNEVIEQLNRQYAAFVRIRQAATQSYEGYDERIRRDRLRIEGAREKVRVAMAQQGQLLESMAVQELGRRRARLEELQVKARFALGDSYDRAIKAEQKRDGQ